MTKDDSNSRASSKFDVRTIPMQDIFAAAPTDALIDWFRQISVEVNCRRSEGRSPDDWLYSIQVFYIVFLVFLF